jgi:hypothetical protein
MATAITTLLLSSVLLLAHAPDEPWADWYNSLKIPGAAYTSCCGEQHDCGPTVTRIDRGMLEAYIDTRTFGPTAPNDWVRVPESVILRGHQNPTGEAVACWHFGRFLCFVPSAQT